MTATCLKGSLLLALCLCWAAAPAALAASGKTAAKKFPALSAAAPQAATPSLRNADIFPGSDQGAKINAAVEDWKKNGGACQITLEKPGTISTAPDLPLGCSLDVYSPQTLAVSWPLPHHGVRLDFHGKTVSFSGTGPAFDIGKASALAPSPGTVDTNGPEVTWVSGPDFSDLDLGDQICIGDGCYNIASLHSAKALTLTSPAGRQSKAPYVAFMVPENAIANNPTIAPATLRNVVIILNGGSGAAVRSTYVTGLTLDQLKVFGGFSLALDLRGSITTNIYGLQAVGTGILLQDYGFAGQWTGSNHNRFFGGDVTNAKGATAVNFTKSSNNAMFGFRLEGNSTTNSWHTAGGSNNACYGCYFDRNGDGTSSSNTISIAGTENALIDSSIVTDVGNGFNNGGNAVSLSGTTSGSMIRATAINGNSNSFGTAIHLEAPAQVKLDSNVYSGAYRGGTVAGSGSAFAEDSAGNYTVRSLSLTGGGIIAPQLPTSCRSQPAGSFWRDGTAVRICR